MDSSPDGSVSISELTDMYTLLLNWHNKSAGTHINAFLQRIFAWDCMSFSIEGIESTLRLLKGRIGLSADLSEESYVVDFIHGRK